MEDEGMPEQHMIEKSPAALLASSGTMQSSRDTADDQVAEEDEGKSTPQSLPDLRNLSNRGNFSNITEPEEDDEDDEDDDYSEDEDEDEDEDDHNSEEEPFSNSSAASHRVVVEHKTRFQQVTVKEDGAGKFYMQLNGETQNHEDEAALSHYMMVDVPMMMKGNAQSMLIRGGGDGLPARHALQHSSLINITMVELDGELVELHQKNDVLRRLTEDSLNDPRVEIRIDDAYTYMWATVDKFDIVLNDIEVDFTEQAASKNKRATSLANFLENLGPELYVQTDWYPRPLGDNTFSSDALFASLVASYARVSHVAFANHETIPLFQLSLRTRDFLRHQIQKHLGHQIKLQELQKWHPNASLYFSCVDFSVVSGFEGKEDNFGWELYFYFALKGPIDETKAIGLKVHKFDMGKVSQ